MPVQSGKKDRLAKTVRIGQLLELYGSLLTDRQSEFVRLHHDEDMSFGEIAKDFGISRQAVHDAVQQAEASMEHYEAGLGLLAKEAEGETARSDESVADSPGLPAGDVAALIAELDDLRGRLGAQGIIYDAGSYVRALDEMIERLRGMVS